MSVDKCLHAVVSCGTVGAIRNIMRMYEAVQELFLHLVQEFSPTQFVSALLAEAVRLRVSDVHVDPEREGTRVLFRRDGFLVRVGVLPTPHHAAVLARIKIISNLRTDEHQTAQDGRFDVFVGADLVHVRVTVMPCYFGERMVLRILSDAAEVVELHTLGMQPEQEVLVRSALDQTHGMILVSGPTGSGKTTTLYALLRALQRPEISVVTLEDPVECVVSGVVQIPIHAHRGVSFATGLRSVLRQDPDVIMVGEIRDEETARLAVQAALTGHVVLSSVHTTEAASVFVRLLDLGIEPYLLADTLHLVVAQRLVRLLCTACGGSDGSQGFHARCDVCQGVGYVGRRGLFEVVRVNAAVRTTLRAGISVAVIREALRAQGVASLWESGIALVAAGRTAQVEVARVLNGIT